jgi:RNA polymerase sigma factor (sigma-70 family)
MNIDDNQVRALVEASAGGDADSFKELYEHLVEKVFTYLRFRTATEEMATDLTQDAFVSLYGALPNFSYRSRNEFYAYVFSIVRRTLARHYESKHTKASQSRADVDGEMIPDESGHEELTSDIERAVKTLNQESQDIITLHHWGGYTFGEIGEMLGMTESAVRVRHHRAVHSLKTFFEESDI